MACILHNIAVSGGLPDFDNDDDDDGFDENDDEDGDQYDGGVGAGTGQQVRDGIVAQFFAHA